MTIATTAAIDLPIETIVLRAYQLAGLMDAGASTTSPNWPTHVTMAKDFLELDIKGLQARGFFTRSIDTYALAITTETAGTNPYTLSADTLDVLGTAMYLPTGVTDAASAVVAVTREQYQLLSNKTVEGRPQIFCLEHKDGLRVYFWPVPGLADTGTVTFQRVRILATMRDGNKTIDMQGYWHEYFLYSLAHKLALSAGQPVSRLTELQSLKQEAFSMARNYSREHATSTIFINHRIRGGMR